DLLDVLLLMAAQEESVVTRKLEDLVAPFALYWLLFVHNGDKAAKLAFNPNLRVFKDGLTRQAIIELVARMQEIGAAGPLPSRAALKRAKGVVATARAEGNHLLRLMGEGFMLNQEVHGRSVG